MRQISVQSTEHEFEINSSGTDSSGYGSRPLLCQCERDARAARPHKSLSPEIHTHRPRPHPLIISLSASYPNTPRRSLRRRHSRGGLPHVRYRDGGRGQVLGLQRRGSAGNREQRVESEPTSGRDRYSTECALVNQQLSRGRGRWRGE